MPIRYELDDLDRRVVITIEGAFQMDDMFAIMARQRAEHTWRYGTLYDLRGMTEEPPMTDLRQIMSEAAELRRGEGSRGAVALLATDPTLYGTLCTYAALGQTTVTVGVFRDWDEAEQWLAATLKGEPR